MAATAKDIKNFFALARFAVTDCHLLMVQEALVTQYYGRDKNSNPRTPTADDFIDWLYRQAKAFVNRQTEMRARQAARIPPEDLLDG